MFYVHRTMKKRKIELFRAKAFMRVIIKVQIKLSVKKDAHKI